MHGIVQNKYYIQYLECALYIAREEREEPEKTLGYIRTITLKTFSDKSELNPVKVK